MASLIRPTRPFPLPVGADVVQKDGRPHARLAENGRAVLYPVSKDGTKYLKPAKKWYAQYTDALGRTRRKPLATNKEVAQRMLGDLMRKVERERAGDRDPFEDHRRKPLAVHLTDWETALRAAGRTDDYVELKLTRVRQAFEGCQFVFLGDLSAERLGVFLAGLRDAGRSVQTTNDWLQAVKQFARWVVDHGRAARNPFTTLKPGNAGTDPRHNRRALSPDEVARLLDATRASGATLRGLSGEARYHLYLTALLTGFRAKELSSLTPEAFDLSADPPTVFLRAAATKNGKPAHQPLPAELVEALRGFLTGKPGGEPLWPGKWVDRPNGLLQQDLAVAGIPYAVDGPNGPEHADFHALRVTYITSLARAGVSPTLAKELARHSDVRLTTNTYTKLNLHDRRSGVDALPRFTGGAGNPIPVTQRATGTDGPSGSRLLLRMHSRMHTDALPDAQTVGAERGRVRGTGCISSPGVGDGRSPEALESEPLEGDRGGVQGNESGEGGIRTRGAVLPARRFSKAVLSTTQPPLRQAES